MGHNHKNEETVLCNLIYLMDMGIYDGHNILQIPSLNLKISLFLNNVQEKIVQAIFSIEHPEFEEDIIESVVGVGENTKQALESATKNFYNATMTPLLAGLKDENYDIFEVFLQKKIHLFRKYESDLVCIGNKENLINQDNSLLSIIKDKLPLYLGTKKAYIIKLFASHSVGEYICEVRINGVLVPALRDMLVEYAKNWRNVSNYYAEKQCIFLLQEDSTYEVCPYTRQNIIDLTIKLISAFEAGQTAQDIIYQLEDSDENNDVIKELVYLIPEIYCEVTLNNLKYSDIIVLMEESGKNEIIHSTQMRNYSYVKEAIYTYFEKNKPSDSDIFKIISQSKRYFKIEQEFNAGKDFKDIDAGYLVLPVDKDYKLF